jgi:hypothetical protein
MLCQSLPIPYLDTWGNFRNIPEKVKPNMTKRLKNGHGSRLQPYGHARYLG